MTITKNQEADKLTVSLEGRLDTVTSPQLEGELSTSVNGVTELVIDLQNLDDNAAHTRDFSHELAAFFV